MCMAEGPDVPCTFFGPAPFLGQGPKGKRCHKGRAVPCTGKSTGRKVPCIQQREVAAISHHKSECTRAIPAVPVLGRSAISFRTLRSSGCKGPVWQQTNLWAPHLLRQRHKSL